MLDRDLSILERLANAWKVITFCVIWWNDNKQRGRYLDPKSETPNVPPIQTVRTVCYQSLGLIYLIECFAKHYPELPFCPWKFTDEH